MVHDINQGLVNNDSVAGHTKDDETYGKNRENFDA
jgi:phosphopentomutase